MANLADQLMGFFMRTQHGEHLEKITLYHAHAGVVQQAPKLYGLTALKGGMGLNGYSLVLNHNSSEFELDYEGLGKMLGRIDRLVVKSYATEGAYRGVKDNPAWRTMYRVGPHDLKRIDTLGGTGTGQMDACPCFNCGFLVPLAGIEIDHHKPRVGGGDQAILKLFRLLRMTEEPGKGRLATVNGKALRKGKPQFGNLAVAMNPHNNPMGSWDPKTLPDEHLQARYALDMEGILVLSVAVALTSLEDMRQRCLHSYVNLRPFCAACNSNKSNKLKVIL